MRIHEITLKNYRGVRERTVKFAETGVTVVEGENEAGKSSLIEGLFLLLDYPDNSAHRDVKAVRPVDTGADPEVEAVFTLGEYRIDYGKRWNTGASRHTRLAISGRGREQHTGAEAHSRLKDLVAQEVDEQLWRALRLQQGVALKQGQQVTPSLGAALAAAAGDDGSSSDHGPLVELIQSARDTYVTPGRGNLKGPVAALKAEVEQSEAVARELKQKLVELASDIDRVERTQRDSARARRELARNEERIRDQRARWAAIEAQHTETERLRIESERAQERAQGGREALNRRTQLVARVDAATREAAEAEGRANRFGPERELGAQRRAEAEAERALARGEVARARALRDLRTSDEVHLNDLLQLTLMTERLEHVRAREAIVTEALAFIEGVHIDASGVRRIERLQLAAVQAGAKAEAEAPTLTVRALRPIPVNSAVGEDTLGTGEERAFVGFQAEPIRIGDVAEVSVRSGSGVEELIHAATATDEHYRTACSQAGIADVAEARDLLQRRQRMEERLADAQTSLKEDLRDLTPLTLAEKIERLQTGTKVYAEHRAKAPSLAASLDEAKRLRADAQRRFESAESADLGAETALERTNEAAGEVEHSWQEANLEAENARGVLKLAASDLVAAREQDADDVVTDRATSLVKQAEGAAGRYATAERALRSANPDGIKLELENQELLQHRLDREIRALENERAGLKAAISLRGEEGLADRLAEAETDAYRRLQVWQATERRAAAARLLSEVFDHHRTQAVLAYLRPFKDKVESLGTTVFGTGFEVDVNQDLEVTQRTLGGVTVPYDSLSTGAKEQIGVLSRLACAALVSKDGGVPLILDDALGWSDPVRLEKLGAAFNVGARDCQVIVLTCMPDRYRNIGSATVVRISGGE